MRSETTRTYRTYRTYRLTDLSGKEIVLLAQAMTTLVGKKGTKDNDALLLEQHLRRLVEEMPF